MMLMVFLSPNKAGPKVLTGGTGVLTGRAVQKIKYKGLQPVLIAAAVVERVASAWGIVCMVVRSVCLLCTLSLGGCASLSRNPITIKNSMY